MSNYHNFIEDFPGRCRDLLTLAEHPARIRDREVTLMLMVAASGMVIPYERLRRPDNAPHPAQDRSRHPRAAEAMDRLLRQAFVQSELWIGSDGSWAEGTLSTVGGDPSEWPAPQPVGQRTPSLPVKEVLRTVRNGLAHGNVYTRTGVGRQIAAILFVCEAVRTPSARFRIVEVSPQDFRLFLDRWFDFVEGLRVSYREIAQLLGEAA